MSYLQTDLEQPFGHYCPDRNTRRWLQLARHAPRNFLGQRLVDLARRRVLAQHGEPLDVEVSGLCLRSYFSTNHTERKFVFTPRRFDRKERAWLREALPGTGVFVDIGANAGIYSLLAAQRMSAAGRVLALEPFAPLYQRMRFNIQANAARAGANWPRVDCLPVGVAASEGQRQLYINQRNLGESSLLSGQHGNRAVSIICRPLLVLLQEQGVNAIDVLKIDIEGAEDEALCPFLSAAPDSLLPAGLLIEDSRAQWQQNLPAALTERGYRLRQRAGRNLIYERRKGGKS